MMCDECDEVPARYVAYFNRAGGKLWRPAQTVAATWAIGAGPGACAPVPVDIREVRLFVCDDVTAAAPAEPETV